MVDNPFAPPSAAAGSRPARGLVFSPEGVAVVGSLATWMRALSIILLLLVGVIALGSFGLLMAVDQPAILMVMLLLPAMLLGAAATWLRGAARGFERGVASDDEGAIGQGFRNLRAYLVLVGIVSVLSLVGVLLDVAYQLEG